jgi:folate-binding protein YgfZ
MEAATSIEMDGQYRVLHESAGLLERRDRSLYAVTGPDAAEYLQSQITNDVESLEPGGGCYAALLDRKGRMQGDMRVVRTDDGFLIDTELTAGDAIRRHLDTYRIGREVSVEERSGELAILSAIGPAANRVTVDGPLAPEHAHREVEIGGRRCRAIATDLGVDLLVATGDLETVSEAVLAAGAEPVSEQAAEIVRVESGRPRFGHEMTASTIPQEAGINERAVSFTKGCYIGQETVARLHYKGKPNRRLVGLRTATPARVGEPIRLGERELGSIGTAVLSPAKGPIALAIVRREAQAGATVMVGEGLEAEVVELPF